MHPECKAYVFNSNGDCYYKSTDDIPLMDATDFNSGSLNTCYHTKDANKVLTINPLWPDCIIRGKNFAGQGKQKLDGDFQLGQFSSFHSIRISKQCFFNSTTERFHSQSNDTSYQTFVGQKQFLVFLVAFSPNKCLYTSETIKNALKSFFHNIQKTFLRFLPN